jgi:hypothetical protein
MYQFTSDEIAVLNAALVQALAVLRRSPHPVPIADDAAKQFLSRELLRLYREGVTERDALARNSVPILRNFVQAQESARRTVKAMKVSSLNEASALRDPFRKRQTKQDKDRTVKTIPLRLRRSKARFRSRDRLLKIS